MISVVRTSAVFVDLPGLASICVSGRRLNFSIALLISAAITASSSFPIVLSKAIGLYPAATVYNFFPSFRITIVHLYRNSFR